VRGFCFLVGSGEYSPRVILIHMMEPKQTLRPPRWSSKLILLVFAGVFVLGILHPFASVAASHANSLPLPMTDDQSQITNGILVLGILLVVIIIVGVLLGSSGRSGKKPKPKKQN
jgi:hypothetical protein